MSKKTTLVVLIMMMTLTSFAQYNNAFRFKIIGNGYSDETIIRLLDGASQNFDGNYDAWKLFSINSNILSIYTKTPIGQALSINSLPKFTEDKSITIYTDIPVNGTYTINIEEIYELTSNYKVSLTEITSNTHYILLGDTALSFTFNTQQNSPSFTFNFSTPIVSSTKDETCFEMKDGELMINNAGNTDWDIEIFDASNNAIVNKTVTSSIGNFNKLAAGDYSAQVSSKGISDHINFSISPAAKLTADFSLDKDTIYLSQGGIINPVNNSQNTQNYVWDFGDGGSSSDENPTYAYSSVDDYNITLSTINEKCVSQSVKKITVLQSQDIATSVDKINTASIKLATLGNGNYQLTTVDFSNKKIVRVYDVKGNLIYETGFFEKKHTVSLNNHPKGIYILTVATEDGHFFQKKLLR